MLTLFWTCINRTNSSSHWALKLVWHRIFISVHYHRISISSHLKELVRSCYCQNDHLVCYGFSHPQTFASLRAATARALTLTHLFCPNLNHIHHFNLVSGSFVTLQYSHMVLNHLDYLDLHRGWGMFKPHRNVDVLTLFFAHWIQITFFSYSPGNDQIVFIYI